ncbi:MAG TPA: PEP-CTERM sorting domain-containing protein [Stellaceae bacterium]|nr:PEP-CTERM sorting domain-containing protein [Stellaceae bacterium]
MLKEFLARSVLATALVVGAAVLPARASVLYYDFSFSGDGVAGAGTIITAATPDPSAPLPDAYDILSISGEVNGSPITGLAGGVGPVEYSADGYFIYDNDFYVAGAASPAGGFFDDDGLLLDTAGNDYNLFYDGSNYWYWADQGGGIAVSFNAVDPPAPVPEPGTLPLFAAMLAALAASRPTRRLLLRRA